MLPGRGSLTRRMWWSEVGRAFIPPSPNMPTPDTALVYPGMCLLEGTTLSEGRGTCRPFEQFGAPWLDAPRLARAMSAARLPGVRFAPVAFTPDTSKHQGQPCQGLRLSVTDAVGTGPFKFESFTVGQETTLIRNDDYTWGSELAVNAGPAKFDHAIFREIPEDSTAFLELKTGGVDMLLGIPTDYLGEVAKEPSLAVLTLPGQELSYFVMNVTKAPFDDIKVREAAAKAINQKEIVDNIYGGVGQPADTFLISALAESKVAPQYKISYDPDRANKLLDEAGWVMGADGIRAKDGQPLHIDLWTQSDSSFRRLTEVVQAQLKAVGIDATITTFDSSTIRDEYKKDVHQAAVRSYFWDNADIIDWFFGADRAGYPNISMLNDPKAEELRAKAMTGSKNGAERIANFTAYHEYILSLFPFSPIYQPVVSVGYNKDRLKLIDNSNLSSFQQESILGLEVLN